MMVPSTFQFKIERLGEKNHTIAQQRKNVIHLTFYSVTTKGTKYADK